MQNVFTTPCWSTQTWLCSQTISGNDSSTILRDRRPTSGIRSSVTSNLRSIRYRVMHPPRRSSRDQVSGAGDHSIAGHLDFRRRLQGLQDDAVAFGFLDQCVHVLPARRRSIDVEANTYGLESNPCAPHQPERSTEVEVAFDSHLNL